MKSKTQRFIKPKPLKKGAQIALAAPASHFRRENFDVALQYLTSRGYRVTYQDNVFSREDYLAGSDERRFAEISDYLANPDIDAIFLLRGGFGSARMFHLPIKPFKLSHAKHIWGMSDHTFLLNYISRKNKLVTTHSPIITSEMFRTMPDDQKNNMMNFLQKKSKQIVKAPEIEVIRKGNASGQLWGGNLTILQTTFGTPFQNNWNNCILFLEDINEPEYRLDRTFAHLYLTGQLSKIKGLILGDFTDKDNKQHAIAFFERMIQRYVPKNIPVIARLKAGHQNGNVILPIGGQVSIKHQGKTLEIDSIV